MRKLTERGTLATLSSEVLSVLQRCAIDEPLFPNLKTLNLHPTNREFVPSIPLFLSPRTTTISIDFETDIPRAMVASMITAFPILCPNLQDIDLNPLPRDPIITTAVSGMFLAINRNTLQCVDVDSPLTEEACGVISKLPDLRKLSTIVGRCVSLSRVVFPNLTNLITEYDYDSDWSQMFCGVAFGKLEAVTFNVESEEIGNFLEVFESVATPALATLSTFRIYNAHPWRPNYRSLLPFTQLKELTIEFSCEQGCSSTIDDDVSTDIARAMPKLEFLQLGGPPCQTSTGVTAKGLAAIAYHCPDLSALCIHFQVANLDPPAANGVTHDSELTIPRPDCALTELEVGELPVPEEFTLVVVLTLVRIFPRIRYIIYSNEEWEEVANEIYLSRGIIDRSSKKPSPHPLEVKLMTPPLGTTVESAI